MKKSAIVVIDTDYGFIQRFDHNLNVEDLHEKYDLINVVPKTTLSQDELISLCVAQVKEIADSGTEIECIFVDIVITESGSTIDKTGLIIAKNLRAIFTLTPIFNITSKYINEDEANIISEASLEDVDGVLIKSFLEGKTFSVKRFRSIIEKSKFKRKTHLSNSPEVYNQSLPDEFMKAYGHETLDPRLKQQISEIGINKFWLMLKELLPNTEGTITYLQPGRSGAYVFKINARFIEPGKSVTLPKRWILKIGFDLEQISTESLKQEELKKTPLNRKYYPRLIKNSPCNVGNISGLLFEMEDDTSSFADAFNSTEVFSCDLVIDQIKDIFHNLYGEPTKKLSKLWLQHYKLNDSANTKILSDIETNYNVYSEIIDKKHIDNVISLVNSIPTDKQISTICNKEFDIDLRNIHGDFNCRNILLDTKNKLSVIDFSTYSQGHIVRDAAKLERDLIFRVVDNSSSNYYDWRRIESLRDYNSMLEIDKFFTDCSGHVSDRNIQCAMKMIFDLRNIVREMSPVTGAYEYSLCLIHYLLLSIIHSEISIQRRVYAIECIGIIIGELGIRVAR